MDRGIRLSPKHGVNPSVTKCFVCGEDDGLALFGRLPKDQEAPRTVCLNKDPCPKCHEWMAKGCILISVRVGESGDNPYRTGGWVVLKDEAIRRLPVSDTLIANILKKRMVYLPDDAWDALGLPRGCALGLSR